LKRNGKRNCRH